MELEWGPFSFDNIVNLANMDGEIANQLSSFEGMVSTSNHLVPGENVVWIKTSKAIWWTAELKGLT